MSTTSELQLLCNDNDLTDNDRLAVLACAQKFGVPIVTAYRRAKELALLSYQQTEALKEAGPLSTLKPEGEQISGDNDIIVATLEKLINTIAYHLSRSNIPAIPGIAVAMMDAWRLLAAIKSREEVDTWETPLGWQKVPKPYGRDGDVREALKQLFQDYNISKISLSEFFDAMQALAYASPSEQISGEAVERVTDAMVERAHAEYHKVLGDPNRSNPMRAALEAALRGPK